MNVILEWLQCKSYFHVMLMLEMKGHCCSLIVSEVTVTCKAPHSFLPMPDTFAMQSNALLVMTRSCL